MRLDPQETFDAIKAKVTDSIASTFPIEKGNRIIEAKRVWVDDNKDVNDLRGQKRARQMGGTWSVPIKAEVALKDRNTGRVIDERVVRLADLPKTTPRLASIVGGNEYYADNMLLLKPGVYSRIREDGTLASDIHTKGKMFKVRFDPESKKFGIQIGGSKPDLYPVLKSIGVDDASLEKAWGKEILDVNKESNPKAVDKMFTAFTGRKPENREQAIDYLIRRFRNTELDPSVTSITLDKPYDKITPDVLVDSSKQLLKISRGEREPDNRDSLLFKKFKAIEDHLASRINESKSTIHRKVANNFRRFDDVNRLIPHSAFQKPIDSFYTESGLASPDHQLNPIKALSAHTRTSVVGEGGLASEYQATTGMRLVDPSHMGFLDPLNTPEGGRVGLTLHLTEGVKKEGENLSIPVWDIQKGELTRKTVQDLRGKKIVLPDQVRIGSEGIKFTTNKAKVYDVEDGVLSDPMNPKKADYALVASEQLFSAATNLLPFLQNNSPLRATVASRQLEQALPLVNRKPPPVQVGIMGASGEQRWGKQYAHVAPVDGVVKKIGDDEIQIKDKDGETHSIQTYRNFPLNGKNAFLDSEPRVVVGDVVKRGDVIADSNVTRDGQLALGTPLRAAYLPMKGLTYEDAVLVSETGAKKLTSLDLREKSTLLQKEDVLGKRPFLAYYGSTLDRDQAKKLDDDGVIRVGELVTPGDTLIAALKKAAPSTESKALRRLHKSLVKPYNNAAVTWDSDRPGIVTDVVKQGRKVKVYVKSEREAEVGDKIVGRYGNKGIISAVIPDGDMPKTKDNRPVELLMNPSSVPGRINLGQVLEVAAGKVAEKTGKPYLISNFDGTKDVLQKIKDDLKNANIEDKEVLYDPKTERPLGKVLVGPHYTFKLMHEVEKARSARAGGPGYPYDRDRAPKRGGPIGAKSLGNLGLYGMLARGVPATIREMRSWKSDMDQSDKVWTAIQSGGTIPSPRPTYAFNKFMSYLNALGVNTKKDGNTLVLTPMTDKQVLEMSNGEIKDPGKMVMGVDPNKPEKNGLFDPQITGGLEGAGWAHIKLPEPVPNPVFEGATKRLLGLTGKTFDAIVAGKKGIDKDGNIVDANAAVTVGGPAIKKMLNGIDVDAELTKAENEIKTASKTQLSNAYKRLRYLRALKENQLDPAEAYMTNYIPVLPPSYRPLRADEKGNILRDDLNEMYRGVGQVVKQFKEVGPKLPREDKVALRQELYDGMKALSSVGTYPLKPWKGIMDIIEGKRPQEGKRVGSPKEGFFQKKLLSARQDLTMYSTITPDPTLGLDQVGIPRKLAMETYKPFVVREISATTGLSPLKAQQLVRDNDVLAQRALERVVEDRPIWIKRDPVLHKYGVQAFKPKLVSGNIIKVHPLVTGGFNADHDGDKMSAFVPISPDAVKEARENTPSNNLFHATSGKLMYLPSQEMQTGLFLMSREGAGKVVAGFATPDDAETAARKGEIKDTDPITINGKKTTIGRVRIASTLPGNLGKEFLEEGKPFDKNEQRRYLEIVARNHKESYGDVANKLKDLGNQHVYDTGFSLGLSDFTPEKKIRDAFLSKADALAKGKTPEAKVKIYDKATEAMMKALASKKIKNPDTMWLMQSAGVKPGPDQYRQLILAPMLMRSPDGKIIPDPVKKSFSEGLDLADYWTAVSGARRGIIQKVQSVKDPGYLTKQMMNSVLDEVVISDDCGTQKGIRLPVDEDNNVSDRVLAQDVRIGKTTLPAGTLLDQNTVGRLRTNKISHVAVRSPLRCQHGVGVCKKCYGLKASGEEPEIGDNIGVLSAQALGERSTQLALKAFHGGGVVPAGGVEGQKNLLDKFARVQQLLTLPKNVPGSATLASMESKEGVVEGIKKDAAGGHEVTISGTRHYIPNDRGAPKLITGRTPKLLKIGDKVRRGDPISEGPINPHELLPLAGLSQVQRYLSNSIYDAYRSEGVDRRAVETVVRSLTNTATVEDPGDIPGFTRGDTVPVSVAKTLNSRLGRERKPMKIEPLLRGVEIMPLEKTEDWMARMNHNRLRNTVIEAAQQGWKSAIHGVHPIPAAAYGAEFGKGKFY